MSGLGDGLDARTTIRRWHEGEVYVREADRTRIRVTNGLIDYTSDVEGSPVHLNDDLQTTVGWIDPSLLHIGSASWEVGASETIQEEPAYVTRRLRQLPPPHARRSHLSAGRRREVVLRPGHPAAPRAPEAQ